MISILIAVVALIACGVMGLALRSLGSIVRENHRATVRAIAQISGNTRRVDDRLSYYENRNLQFKQLRADYNKQLAKAVKRAQQTQDDDADAAPEGTAQSEHLID